MGLKVDGSGLKVQGSEFRFGVWGSGFDVHGRGFRVQGLVFPVAVGWALGWRFSLQRNEVAEKFAFTLNLKP
jgi:hypothetical protein